MIEIDLERKNMLKRFIGDRAFYRRVLMIAIPIIIQNGITNFVSLLDNIMVGQVGTAQMSGVSIVNTLLLVFNLCIFGASSGAGIFTAQFHGSQDDQGIRHTFRFKLLACSLLSAIGIAVFLFFGDSLISLYLQGEGEPEAIDAVLQYGSNYLKIMLFGLVPFGITNAYSSTLRETEQTIVPMAASIAAVFVNLVLNYVLIFGHFGAPAMGIAGAAVATVISRYVELAIVVLWTHLHKKQNAFIVGAYRYLYIPGNLLRSIFIKGLPLLVNELCWSVGIAFLNQCYTTRGLDVVAAMNISSTLSNLCNVVYIAMGCSVGILIGQMLGSGAAEEEVRDANRKLISLSVFLCIGIGAVMAATSGLFPKIYNTTEKIRQLAATFLCITAIMMPVSAYAISCYYTLRAGGQALITFLMDGCFIWLVSAPLAFILSRFTTLPIIWLYALCQGTEILKCILGFTLVRRGSWIRNLTV